MNWQQKATELYGERHWKLALSLIAGVTKRTVQRWATGESRVPEATVHKINITYSVWRG